MTAWADSTFAGTHWPDASTIPPGRLTDLLDAATTACIAYAPTPLPSTIPTSYKLACVLHARELYAAAQRDGDVIGVGDYALRVRPLTDTVKALLRPTGRPPIVG